MITSLLSHIFPGDYGSSIQFTGTLDSSGCGRTAIGLLSQNLILRGYFELLFSHCTRFRF